MLISKIRIPQDRSICETAVKKMINLKTNLIRI